MLKDFKENIKALSRYYLSLVGGGASAGGRAV